MTTSPMICPECGGEMNHHADKLVHSSEPPGSSANHHFEDGTVTEFHTCGKCGIGAARQG
ncbi:MAG TPA: hypothetical protein VIJ01_00730 [Candidatus Angelobacter sp.]